MNFVTADFLLFFVIALVGLVWLSRPKQVRVRNLYLLALSYFFYASWDWRYLLLIVLSSAVDYAAGRALSGKRSRRDRLLLVLSLVVNLGMLATFKYFNFFASSANELAELIGLRQRLPEIYVLLPVGISFYTFQTLSYTIDRYYGKIDAERSFINFATFVAFFPQLVAGPIVRARHLLPQLARYTVATRAGVGYGVALMLRGAIKKVCFADTLAAMGIDAVFADPGSYATPYLWLALYGYALQIYFDFSGYSDIAIGAARVMGFSFPKNFNRPYWSRTPSEFWERWHISLSSWLRDYLYIPLGGNRAGRRRTLINLMLTMGLGGLWHGAAWNFIWWGLYHGSILVVSRFFWPFAKGADPLAKVASRIFMFHVVCFGWLLFRVSDMSTFNVYLGGMVFGSTGTSQLHGAFVLLLALGLALHYTPRRWFVATARRFARLAPLAQALIVLGVVAGIAGLTQETAPFIYFQF